MSTADMARAITGLHRVYYVARKPLLAAVNMMASARLRQWFVKGDHWIRIRCKQKNVVAKRNGLTFKLDLAQLIDNQLYFESIWEPKTLALFERLLGPGMTVMDIGANVGAHTLVLARLVGAEGRVFAIEPTDWAYRRLRENLVLNPAFERVVVTKQLALTDRSSGLGDYRFRARWWKEGGHIDDEEGKIEFLSLDDFQQSVGLEKLDFVKLDVDGFETKVLKGAAKTIFRLRPLLLVEMSDFFQRRAGNSAEEMISTLNQLGYAFYYEDLTEIIGPLQAVIDGLKDWETINVVCIPAERNTGPP